MKTDGRKREGDSERGITKPVISKKPTRPHAKSGQLPPGGKKDAERLQFTEWLALPSEMRKPKHQGELAKQLGVDSGTLSDWKRSPDLWDQVRKLVDEGVKEHHADVISATVKAAKCGNIQAQNLYLEYIQNWSEGKRHEIRSTERIVIDVSKLTDEELRELDAAIAASHQGRDRE